MALIAFVFIALDETLLLLQERQLRQILPEYELNQVLTTRNVPGSTGQMMGNYKLMVAITNFGILAMTQARGAAHKIGWINRFGTWQK